MPFHGGVIGIGITPGLSSYGAGRTISGLRAISFGSSSKSFYTMKIDNVDMARSNIRIVNDEGLISPTGRVELRSQGVWGSVCASGVEKSFVRTLCKQLAFLDGIMVNGDGPKQLACENYKGENYCGEEA